MPSYDLEILQQHRHEILKAELGAFLHNIGKFGKEFVFVHLATAGNTQPGITRYQGTFKYQEIVGIKYRYDSTNYPKKEETLDFLEPRIRNWLENTVVNLPPPFHDRGDCALGDFIEYQARDFYRSPSDKKYKKGRWSGNSYATELLESSHHASGVDKEAKGDPQIKLPVHLATVFGYEQSIDLDRLKSAREQLLAHARATDRHYVGEARRLMVLALGDTRRPLNDVTLWDVSSAVAAFYKAAMAKMLLEQGWTPRDDLRWRVLRVGLDGPAFYHRVSKLPDLLVRMRIIEQSLNEVRTLLEETYPIANEVYRDEFGSAFVVPDLKEEDEHGTRILGLLRNPIIEAFRRPFSVTTQDRREGDRAVASKVVKLEITPKLRVSAVPQEACSRVGTLEVGEIAKQPPLPTASPKDVSTWWPSGLQEEVCTVCGVRPQGFSITSTTEQQRRKAKQRHLCVACEALREDRCEEWLHSKLDKTIWLDEVVDANGRLALLVGRFAIDEWLTSQTEKKSRNGPGAYVESSLLADPTAQDPSRRFKALTFARLRRIWDTTARFWEEIQSEAENLPLSGCRWRLRLNLDSGAEMPVRTHAYEIDIEAIGRLAVVCNDADQCSFITTENLDRLATQVVDSERDELLRHVSGQQCKLYETRYDDTAGYTRAEQISKGTIQEVSEDPTRYRGLIPILANPRSFMMLLPAEKTPRLFQAIKCKYDAEMARVRNRLPLALGVVFAEAHTPLGAVLDAGQRMMDLPVKGECWTLADDVHRCENDWLIKFSNGVTWRAPAVMGDGITEDEWYTYFLRHPSGQAVHVRCLQRGSSVWVTPSRFDFQFLDCAATRFELHYDGASQEYRAPRPYRLEQWDEIALVWEMLSKGLTTSQVKAVQADIGAKWRHWSQQDRVFERFVRDTLATADWATPLCRRDLDFLTGAGVSGLLEDTIELFVGILKQRPQQGG